MGVKIDWYEADILALFLQEHAQQFEDYIVEFGWVEEDARAMRQELQEKFLKEMWRLA